MFKRLTALSLLLLILVSCGKEEEVKEPVTIAESVNEGVAEVTKEKRALTPDDYAAWQRLGSYSVSTDGKWVNYSTEPNRGDKAISLHETETGKQHTFERAERAAFSPKNDFLAFKRVPKFETDRQAKLDKVKKDKQPKDSLGVYLFVEDTLIVIPRIKSFDVADEGSPWVAVLLEKPLPLDEEEDTAAVDSSALGDSLALADTTAIDTSEKKIEVAEEEDKKKEKKKKVREEGTPFWVWNPVTQDTVIMEYVKTYSMSENGKRVVTTTDLKTDSVRISIIDPCKGTIKTILETYGKAKSFSFDEKGEQLVFMFTDDTTDEKRYDIYYWKTGRAKAKSWLSDEMVKRDGWGLSNVRAPRFSKDGKYISLGTAPLPVEEPEDSLLKNEKAVFDLWSWTDPLLMPQQKKELSREKKRNYVAMAKVGSKSIVQLADEEVPTVITSREMDEDLTLGYSNLPYRQLISWESVDYYDYYLVNMKTGEKEKVLEKVSTEVNLSPGQKYLVWYDQEDLNWHAMDVKTGEKANLTEGMDVAFYNEDDDHPWQPGPYGFADWGLGDRYAYIYDKYDIWKFDLTGEKSPLNVTAGAGRKTKDIYRYMKLDSKLDYVPIAPIRLTVFNEKSKKGGYASVNMYEGGAPEKLLFTENKYDPVRKAKCADVIIWRRGSYREYPDVYVSDLDFKRIEKLSSLNPQQSEFRWADVELVEWTNSYGDELQGMLYIPEDLDKSKKHPMMIYYYEKYSDYLYQYFSPTPSYSTINKTMYPSNGYILFIPDIVYKDGHPGRSGLDCVETGLDMLLEKYDFINEDKIGIQGQSWGGYQTAYFITQTDRFAAAMAGAPVSNMTSAYGGIRWGSGLSRAMQYEDGQSRIGGDLWEAFDLYVENSPIFFADQIETPLMMMHNDDDGAVPWTQGIEMMCAMRRLQKPAWMLVYNDTDHNMGRDQWGNRMDLTIRMKQFFDHYLMDEPMPRWMKEGISAMEKGIDMKYDLIEE